MIYLTILPILSSLLCLPFCLSPPSIHHPISTVWTVVNHFLLIYMGVLLIGSCFLSLHPFLFFYPYLLFLYISSCSWTVFTSPFYVSLLYFSSNARFYSELLLLSFSIHLLYVSLWELWKLW